MAHVVVTHRTVVTSCLFTMSHTTTLESASAIDSMDEVSERKVQSPAQHFEKTSADDVTIHSDKQLPEANCPVVADPRDEGSRDRSMRIILPPKDDNAHVIHAIKEIDTFLSLSTTRQILDEILQPGSTLSTKKKKKKQQKSNRESNLPQEKPAAILLNPNAIKSLRYIQAGRYEIFAQSFSYKTTEVFDWLCEHVWSTHTQQAEENAAAQIAYFVSPPAMKCAILKYAVDQAARDGRVALNTHKNKVNYDNFSLIVSYDPVEAQPKHIDLLYPNFQYGLIITDNSPGTNAYHVPHSIRSVKDIKDHVWNDMPPTLYAALEGDIGVTSFIAQFGNVLCPNLELVEYWKTAQNASMATEASNERKPVVNQIKESQTSSSCDTSNLFPTGTLLTLPGSEVHAGPAWDKYRAVLFFSACPDMTKTVPYHPDTQYFAPLLCCDFISLLWAKISVDDRIYMLHRLVDSINDTKCQGLERHISDRNLIQFIRVALNWDKKREMTRYVKKLGKCGTITDFIRSFASQGKYIDEQTAGITVIGKKFTPNGNVVQLPSSRINDIVEKISCAGLVVEYDGEYFPAEIFELIEKRQSVEFLDNQKDKIPTQHETSSVMLYYPYDESWEGHENLYTLEWKRDCSLQSLDIDAGEQELFNGTNGVVRDSDGGVVPCYLKHPSLDLLHNDVDTTKNKRKRNTKEWSSTALKSKDDATNTGIESHSLLASQGDGNLQVKQEISDVCSADVICGAKRGDKYPENVKLRKLIVPQIPFYTEASDCQKKQMRCEIVRNVHEFGGRFLRRNETTKLWYEIDDKDACSTLRYIIYQFKRQNEVTKEGSEISPCDNDVLFSKGYTNHSGNQAFLRLTEQFWSAFEKANKGQQLSICDSMIDTVSAANGRLLGKNLKSGKWEELSKIEAHDEIFKMFMKFGKQRQSNVDNNSE
jgi:hypothetical protein